MFRPSAELIHFHLKWSMGIKNPLFREKVACVQESAEHPFVTAGWHKSPAWVTFARRNGTILRLSGGGGIMNAEDLDRYFQMGADAAMSATGAMWDPYLAYRYWEKENQSLKK